MKYFEVEKKVLAGNVMVVACASDGTALGSYNRANPLEITLGFTVYTWDDVESFEVKWYPVKTDTSTSDYPNNEDDVLAKIKEDHPADEWQNNNW